MTIIEFLEARIAEDEAVIDRRGPYPHSWHGSDIAGSYSPQCPDCLGVQGRARVLAECAAKRAIIRYHAEMVEAVEYLSAALPGNLNQEPDALWRTAPLRALATVYKDHANYDEDWAL